MSQEPWHPQTDGQQQITTVRTSKKTWSGCYLTLRRRTLAGHPSAGLRKLGTASLDAVPFEVRLAPCVPTWEQQWLQGSRE
jgi:hypothetical protein